MTRENADRFDSIPETTYRPVPVGEVKRYTDKAVLLVIHGRELWLPLSAIEDNPPAVGQGGVIGVAEWLAEQEDLPEADEDDEPAAPTVTMFSCRRSTTAVLRRVRHATCGMGGVVAVEGDKCVVRFDAGQQRTILSRFLEDV